MKKQLFSFAAAAFIFPLYSAEASIDNDAFLMLKKKYATQVTASLKT